MNAHEKKYILALVMTVLALSLTGCSTQKNTAKSRWWHSFNARYNTYYNASVAYIDGSLEKENANKDNFTELIPLYTVGNKDNRETGKGNFDRAIEKCQKAIKLHSIKRKPIWNKSRKKTDRDREWLSRKEYNPFLWKAWMLMGRSQFHQGKFDEAASTFAYMSRLYQTQPAIYGKARAWLAKSYIEEGLLYDAEDVIRNIQRDSLHWSARKEWDYTYADYYIHTGEYDKAIPYLRRVIKHEMRRKQRAREWFLMGQLQSAVGNKALAMKAYKRVIRQNPPYEVEFNARIAMTEALSEGNGKKMISRLNRMAASDKNKDYLDQVFYAIGNIYLNQRDTLHAIAAYEKGSAKSTRNGIEKGVLLLRLGDLYWDKEDYNGAQRCYGEAIGLLDKEREDYETLSRRSVILDQLVPYTDAIHLQDSLQELSLMDEKERNEAIDRVIEALKKKEKEEQNKLDEQNAQDVINRNSGGVDNTNSTSQQSQSNSTKSSLWYFYNPIAVSQGKNEFQKRWGKRENRDDWRRINQTVVGSIADQSLSEEQLDSISRAEEMADSLEQMSDSAHNDPHRREYYLAQIPFTEEQKEASNLIIMDGLYNAGVIFKDKFDNLKQSEKHLRRLTDDYPTYENMDDVYYHLFLLYSRLGEQQKANEYVERLKQEYEKSEWTTLLSDPYYAENAKWGAHIEDSIYAETYSAFKESRFEAIEQNVKTSETRFPLGANRDKFIFIGALNKLNNGNSSACIDDMKTLVEKYPKSELATLAGMIINGANAGRPLRGGNFDIKTVWNRRTEVLNPADSTKEKELSNERNTNFVYIIAYNPDSIDGNKLLFDVAKYNFTSYLVRNFDIAITDDGVLRRLTIAGFRSYDEALQYARQLHSSDAIGYTNSNKRSIIISEENLPLLGTKYSYDDYDKFYNTHFAPLEVSTMQLLIEPDVITTVPKRREELTPTDVDDFLNNSTIIDNGLNEPTDENTTTVIPAETEQQKDANEVVIPIEEPTPMPQTQPEKKPTTQPEKPLPTDKKVVSTEKKGKDDKAKEPQKQDEKQKTEEQKKPSKVLEDEFYFDEDVTTTPKKKDDKKKDEGEDDEYYDLDGF